MAETSTITINIDNGALEKVRKLAMLQKQRKGFLGKFISNAVREYVKKIEQEEIRKKALERLEKGFHMGKIKIKHRSELYDRV